MKAKGALEVILFAERKFVGSLMFTSTEVTIGRDPRSMVRLDDPNVSPEHALVHFTGRSCIVEDQPHTSGVFVGGERIESRMLQPMDEVAIGRYSLRFVIHQAEAPSPAPPPVVAPVVSAPPVVAPVVALPVVAAPVVPAAVVAAPIVPTAVIAAPVVPAPVVAAPVAPAPVVARRPPPVPASAPLPSAVISVAGEAEALATGGEVEAIEEAPAPPPPPPHDDDDDDDDDHDFVPAFSLVELLGEASTAPPPGAATAVVQAIFHRDEIVLDLRYLALGDALPLSGAAGGRALFEAAGRLRVDALFGMSGEVHRDGGITEMVDGAVPLLLDARSFASLRLPTGDGLLLRFVAPASRLPSSSSRLVARRGGVLTILGALVVHFLVLVLLSITGGEGQSQAALDINAGRFATLDMKDPLLDQPKPPPKKKADRPVDKPKRPPKPPPIPLPRPTPTTPLLPPSLQKYVNTKAQPSGPVNPKASPAANKLLSALGAVGAPSASSLAMTNLSAVTGPNSDSGFKISGTIGKLQGDGLHLAAGGSGVGRVDTKNISELGQGRLGRIAGQPQGSGKVRGQVTKAPAREVVVQGELDRGEILKVINAHMREVQACYERRLIHDSSLSGKLTVEWTIVPTGMVSVVRVRSSDLKDTEVATCVQGSLRTWVFPQPKGGPVIVGYPFVFSTIGL